MFSILVAVQLNTKMGIGLLRGVLSRINGNMRNKNGKLMVSFRPSQIRLITMSISMEQQERNNTRKTLGILVLLPCRLEVVIGL